MIAVIDYGAGNIRNVVNALNKLEYQVKLTSDPEEMLSADTVILPGVGAAGDTVSSLKKLNLVEPVLRIIAEDRSVCRYFSPKQKKMVVKRASMLSQEGCENFRKGRKSLTWGGTR